MNALEDFVQFGETIINLSHVVKVNKVDNKVTIFLTVNWTLDEGMTDAKTIKFEGRDAESVWEYFVDQLVDSL